MKQLIFLALLINVLMVLFSCNKASITSTSVDHFSSLEEFFSKNGVPVQSFSVNADVQSTITGISGTVIIFQAKSFITRSGTIVTGNVMVNLREIYTEKDMILSGMSTNNETEGLNSGGEYYLRAYQNGQQIFVQQSRPYKVKFSSSYTQAMSGYVSLTKENSAWPQPWVADTLVGNYDTSFTNQNPYINVYDSAFKYFAKCDWSGWCNSDGLGSNGKDSLGCFVNQIDSFSNLMVWFTINGSKYAIATDYRKGNDYPWDYAPTGATGFIVIIGLKSDNSFCSAVVPYDLTKNHDYNVTLNPLSAEAFNKLLDQLH